MCKFIKVTIYGIFIFAVNDWCARIERAKPAAEGNEMFRLFGPTTSERGITTLSI